MLCERPVKNYPRKGIASQSPFRARLHLRRLVDIATVIYLLPPFSCMLAKWFTRDGNFANCTNMLTALLGLFR
jgi:hypothetical protein